MWIKHVIAVKINVVGVQDEFHAFEIPKRLDGSG